jgi:hypothetical protein
MKKTVTIVFLLFFLTRTYSQQGLRSLQDSCIGIIIDNKAQLIKPEKEILELLRIDAISQVMDLESGYGPFLRCKIVRIKNGYNLEFSSDTLVSRFELIRVGKLLKGGNTGCLYKKSKTKNNCRAVKCACVECPIETTRTSLSAPSSSSCE